ncbi:MAG: hypothetical protein WAO77_07575 [Sphingobium sp.]|uniref:hypothetical protein n=1 Tax=Sphingobium sp. TaxID=1912891 RepID=UPI003BAE3B5F
MPQTFTVKKSRSIRRPRAVYPFEDMAEVGDYFDTPDDMGCVLGSESESARRPSILSSARNFARRHDQAFKVATTIWYDHNIPMVRCQRVQAAPSGEITEKPFTVHKAERHS